MIIRLHHTPSENTIVLEGDTIEDIRAYAEYEMVKRGWKEDDCWSD